MQSRNVAIKKVLPRVRRPSEPWGALQLDPYTSSPHFEWLDIYHLVLWITWLTGGNHSCCNVIVCVNVCVHACTRILWIGFLLYGCFCGFFFKDIVLWYQFSYWMLYMIVCECLFCICIHADTDCAACGAAAAAVHGCRQALGESMVYPAGDESRRHLAPVEPPKTQSTLRSPS